MNRPTAPGLELRPLANSRILASLNQPTRRALLTDLAAALHHAHLHEDTDVLALLAEAAETAAEVEDPSTDEDTASWETRHNLAAQALDRLDSLISWPDWDLPASAVADLAAQLDDAATTARAASRYDAVGNRGPSGSGAAA